MREKHRIMSCPVEQHGNCAAKCRTIFTVEQYFIYSCATCTLVIYFYLTEFKLNTDQNSLMEQ